jgi:hypothetical protein
LLEGLDFLHLLRRLGHLRRVGRRAALAPLPAEEPLDLGEVAQLLPQGDGGVELLLGARAGALGGRAEALAHEPDHQG